MELNYLDDSQNEAFDSDYHWPEALKTKMSVIREYFPEGPLRMLDVGGGTGGFSDLVMAEFPEMKSVVFDVSQMLLDRNKQDPKKTLVRGSVDKIGTIFSGQKFDVIAINWLLHHLVGPTHSSCRSNCIEMLKACRDILSERGVIAVSENAFDGPFGTNLPSVTMFAASTTRLPVLKNISKRYFNTAGVGVCFRSRNSWRALFRDAGLECRPIHYQPWPLYLKTRIKMLGLAIIAPAQEHFILTPL